MKILITTDWNLNAVNGVVRSVANLSEELIKLGHDVRILTLSDSIHTQEEGNVMEIGSISARLVYPGARLRIRPARKTLHEVIEWNPDIIHSQCEFSTFVIAEELSFKLKCPIVHTYHTVYEDYTHYIFRSPRIGKTIVSMFSETVAKFCRCIIAPTEKVKKLLEGYGVTRDIAVIPSGIDTEIFKNKLTENERKLILTNEGIPEDAFVCMFLGRLGKEKNIKEIVSNFKDLNLENTYLLIVGGGPDEEEIREDVAKLNAGEFVKFTGMVSPDSVWKYYQVGDIFMSASTSETQGLTYVEALASGLPLLCRKDECLEGVLNDGVNGYCFESKEEFIKGFNSIYDGLKNGKFSEESIRETADKFSKEHFAKSVEAVYEKYLDTGNIRIKEFIKNELYSNNK